MSDTISRQAALGALGERPVVWSDNDDYTLGARNQYDMDRLAIETVPSAQRWISCSERLPEPGVYVLVDGADIPGGDRFPLIDKICDDGEWLNCDGSEWSAVAWMPIPEPWKGERDG